MPVLLSSQTFDKVGDLVLNALEGLRGNGSYAAPGFMKPEGIVIFHVAANMGFKKTLDKDDMPKSLANVN